MSAGKIWIAFLRNLAMYLPFLKHCLHITSECYGYFQGDIVLYFSFFNPYKNSIILKQNKAFL